MTSKLLLLGPCASNQSNESLTCYSYESVPPQNHTTETQPWWPRRWRSWRRSNREVSFLCMCSIMLPLHSLYRRTHCTRKLFLRRTGSLAPARAQCLSLDDTRPLLQLPFGKPVRARGPVALGLPLGLSSVVLLACWWAVLVCPLSRCFPGFQLWLLPPEEKPCSQPPPRFRSQACGSKQDFSIVFPNTFGMNGPQS